MTGKLYSNSKDPKLRKIPSYPFLLGTLILSGVKTEDWEVTKEMKERKGRETSCKTRFKPKQNGSRIR